MVFYKDRFNKWHTEDDFLEMAKLFTRAFPPGAFYLIDHLEKTGCIKEKKNIAFPTVIDFLKMNMRFEAIKRYRDIHNSTLLEAREMVDKIQEDIERRNSENSCNVKR